MRAAFCAALLASVLLLPAPVAAQAPEPLDAVLADRDGDRIPDRLGEAVVVAGRATIDAGALGLRRTTSLASGGRALWLRDIPAPHVLAGDSLLVHGTLGFWNGLAVIDEPIVQRVPAPPRIPAPVRARGQDLERLAGRTVEVTGVVAGINEVASGGQAMTLVLDDRSVIVAFVFPHRPFPLDLSTYEVGDRLHVTGLAGQFDRVAPFEDSYQVYPRDAADIRRGGLSPRSYRWMASGALALLLAALAWVWLLRLRVRRRIEELRRSETRYHALVRSASDAVFVHDIDGRGRRDSTPPRDAPSGSAPTPRSPRSSTSSRQRTTTASARTSSSCAATATRGATSASPEAPLANGRGRSSSSRRCSTWTASGACSRSPATCRRGGRMRPSSSRPGARPRRWPGSRAPSSPA